MAYAGSGYLDSKAVAYYDKMFREALRSGLDLYWQARKFELSNHTHAPSLVSKYSGSYEPVPVIEIANWKNFAIPPDKTVVNTEIEEIAVELGTEAAGAVEFLLRQEAAKSGSQKNVQNIYVSDIFERADGSSNLGVTVVLNTPLSVADPCGMLPGWIAYRFHFACGFPVKAESEYKN